ncbi:unnamed protein product, partial [Prorocentrum cordatum]
PFFFRAPETAPRRRSPPKKKTGMAQQLRLPVGAVQPAPAARLAQRSPSASPGCAPARNATTPSSRRIAYTPTGPAASPVVFATPSAGPERSSHVSFAEPGPPARAQTQPAAVTVIAPGGGTGINGAVYAELGRDPRFNVSIVGQSRAPYDCYPEDWSHGTGPPNLQSFAREVLMKGTIGKTDLLVVGSRGGQVVLPNFWASGARVPPAVVINGGCAMKLPTPVKWPTDAITFILLGGDDNFRGHFSHQQYVADAKSRVPKGNSTTAILYVTEMQHMPQAALLSAILPHMLTALQKWEERGTAPLQEFRPILAALNRDGWSGRLLHTRTAGAWEDIAFSPCEVARLAQSPSRSPACTDDSSESAEEEPIELSRRDELKALWKAAAATARPKCGAPAARDGALFAAVVQAATAQAATQLETTGAPPAAARQPPLLPVNIAGRGDAKALRGGYTPHRLNRADPTPISRALGLGRPSPWVSPKSSYSTARYEFFTPAEVATGGA